MNRYRTAAQSPSGIPTLAIAVVPLLVVLVWFSDGASQSMPGTIVPDLCDAVILCTPPAVCACETDEDESVLRIDAEGDGTFDSRIVRRFDSRGYPRSDRSYIGGSTRPTNCMRYRYDRRGRVRPHPRTGRRGSGSRIRNGKLVLFLRVTIHESESECAGHHDSRGASR